MSKAQIMGRLGGDEFAVTMSVDDHGQAIRSAQSLHANFTAALASSGYPVGCSVGALFMEFSDVRSAEQLIIAVNNLMYAAKRQGQGAAVDGTACEQVHCQPRLRNHKRPRAKTPIDI